MKTFTLLAFLLFQTSAFAAPFQGQQIVMSAATPDSIAAGKEIAKSGGNVVDVAVAMALTLAVTAPYYASLGGGGFSVSKVDGKVDVLDFREMAPQKTHPQFYTTLDKNASQNGGAAVGVPGVPAGLYELHKKYGKLPWTKLFTYPLELAHRGFQVSGEWAESTQESFARFNKGGKDIFAKMKNKPGSQNYGPGETLVQNQLYQALKFYRMRGPEGIYSGPVAKDIVDTVTASQGVITAEDLKNYKVRWLQPITTEFHGHQFYLMPPPSSGGIVMASALKLLEMKNMAKVPPQSAEEFHYIAEILSRSFRGRSLLGDPDFHKNPTEYLLSQKYLANLVATIKKDKTEILEPLKESSVPAESTQTTHLSVLDQNGNAVAMTLTLNSNYGSGVVTEKYGIALNNQMDDFTTRPGEPNQFGLIQGKGNEVQPGKRPLSSMSPTLVEKDGKVIMSIGGVGGPKIISGVTQAIYRVLVTGMNMDEAIQAPRLHHQFLPNKIVTWRSQVQPATIAQLQKMGHIVDVNTDDSTRVFGVRRNAQGILEGAYDSQGEGAAGGY